MRTHGSVFYDSILRAHSHGCHRLFNHLALRLAGFPIANRLRAWHGPSRTIFVRTISADGHVSGLKLGSRGVYCELTPSPVPIDVVEGRIAGRQAHTGARLVAFCHLPRANAARPLL